MCVRERKREHKERERGRERERKRGRTHIPAATARRGMSTFPSTLFVATKVNEYYQSCLDHQS